MLRLIRRAVLAGSCHSGNRKTDVYAKRETTTVSTAGQQITSAAQAISDNILVLGDRRDLLSQNLLSQLRNLVEGLAVRVHTGRDDAPFGYQEIRDALAHVKANGTQSALSRFHRMVQASASHYTVDGDNSERLMLKYYEHLLRVRDLLHANGYPGLLANLEDFPTDLDPQLREYHERIAERITAQRASATLPTRRTGRFYVERSIPFFVNGQILYEVTLAPAANRVTKFDRAVAFTDLDLEDQHAAMLEVSDDDIRILGQRLPISIILTGHVSIRPCEFDNFAKLLDHSITVRSNQIEYRNLNKWLTTNRATLLDLVDLPDQRYTSVRAQLTAGVPTLRIFPALDQARDLITRNAAGHNLLRLLLLRMRNDVIKAQYAWDPCPRLSNLHVKWGCIPFDQMPLATSPAGHNPRYWDLVQALDTTGREHELLARRVRNNVESHGILYTPEDDLKPFGDVPSLVAKFNKLLYSGHQGRRMTIDKKHVVISSYEDETADIITRLQALATSGVQGHRHAVEAWLSGGPYVIDDPAKQAALKDLFGHSKVALIYGAAGTGKSTMLNHIATHYNAKRKLFLANTHSAVDNLRRRIKAGNSDFSTIRGHLASTSRVGECDLLVIDECSTVSNTDLIHVLDSTRFTLLVLVGDIHQIEAIRFGNWFAILPHFLPPSAVFELPTPYRTSNPALIDLWTKVRTLDDTIAETIADAGCSTALDGTLFAARGADEIILCLHYDGLYGINNTNRFLQASNPGRAVTIGVTTYKVGDPILFNDSRRFRPLIYNNTKGAIVGIHRASDGVDFDIALTDTTITELDVRGLDLERLDDSTVRFRVYDTDTTDLDIDPTGSTVPFQVAYAVSIHKAQGLEYESVKVVITDANEDDITHSILYTAITRARDRLRIYWTPETQQAILARLARPRHDKDAALITARKQLKKTPKPRRLT